MQPSGSGKDRAVKFKKLIQERIRSAHEHGDVVADVNAVVAANVGERGETTVSSSHQHVSYSARARASTPGAEEDAEAPTPEATREEER